MTPIIPAPAADPWVVHHNGWYYYCESRDQTIICVRKSRHLLEIGHDDGVTVWNPPPSGPNSKNVWAPELHFLNGRWYIYFAADDGQNENHRMWVLESETTDPQGGYRCVGMLETDGWAIDGTILEVSKEFYFIWSGWPGKVDGRQNLYIARMQNPWTLATERQLLCSPENDWERVAMPICEGPQILKRNGQIFIIYSASASWTVDYCLGMLATSSHDVMNPDVWKKVGPVFKKNDRVWGVGHCSFVQSPCGTEDWIVYHAKSIREDGWLDRQIHAQKFTWDDQGCPDFGTPTPAPRPVRSAIIPGTRIEGTPLLVPDRPLIEPPTSFQFA